LDVLWSLFHNFEIGWQVSDSNRKESNGRSPFTHNWGEPIRWCDFFNLKFKKEGDGKKKETTTTTTDKK
jgi:hypothetical protein